jgi:hypothetical protein
MGGLKQKASPGNAGEAFCWPALSLENLLTSFFLEEKLQAELNLA